jgi:hypothetical protein
MEAKYKFEQFYLRTGAGSEQSQCMTSRDFCYWLQGYFEVAKPKTVNAEEIAMIQRHLSLVFVHEIDPSFGDQKAQGVLNQIHQGIPNSPPPSPPVYRC